MTTYITNILKDPLWDFFLGSLITIIIGITIYILQRRTKKLSYNIKSWRVIDKLIESEGKLEILFEGNKVKNTYLVIMSIINSGNVPITSNDYEKELTFDFGEDSKVLNVEVIKYIPSNLQVELNIKSNQIVRLTPLLLNPRDFFTFKILVSNYYSEPKIECRIVGVNKIVKTKSEYFMLIRLTISTLICLFIGLILNNYNIVPPIFIVMLIVIVMIYFFKKTNTNIKNQLFYNE
jgi:hypothetical protein